MTAARMEPIVGRYVHLAIEGAAHRIYFEEAGAGVPLVCLHTAGAHSSQYRHLMCDPRVTDRFRVLAFDLPWHGKSNPPAGWESAEYRLTSGFYVASVMAFLDALQQHGGVFGLRPNLSKCEVFWPSGNQCFSEFPSSVKRVILSDFSDPVFLGSPVWGSSAFFASFITDVIEKVFALQEHLQDLRNPQVELHLLRSCLGVCKVNYLLRTIPPATIMSQLQLFDRYLYDALSRICNASISAHAWRQATLPLSLGEFGSA